MKLAVEKSNNDLRLALIDVPSLSNTSNAALSSFSCLISCLRIIVMNSCRAGENTAHGDDGEQTGISLTNL